MNARETLVHVADWLGWQDEHLSSGMRNAFDALRLYDYWLAHQETLPEMADEWDEKRRIAALGYDPFNGDDLHAEVSGAGAAADAIRNAYVLLDSVVFVANPSDSDRVKAQLAAAIGA